MEEPILATELLFPVEADLQIFEPRVDGFSVWPVVRYRAWQIIGKVEPEVTSGSVWSRAIRRPVELTRPLYAAWSLLQRRCLRRRHFDFCFLSSEGYRSVKRKDGWWDVYLDDIANHSTLAGKVCRLEQRKFAISPLKASAKRHLFTDAQQIAQGFAGQRGAEKEVDEAAAAVANTFFQKLKEFDYSLDEKNKASFRLNCVRQVRMFKQANDWYGRLFDDISPKVLVLMNAYGRHGAVAAAIERGIPVVEFQHGVIHRDHPGYVWPKEVRQVRSSLPVPNILATYGDFWSNLLTEGGFWFPDEVRTVGSVRMDWLRKNCERKRKADGVTRVIFTTQHPTREQAIVLLREFLREAQKAGFVLSLTIKVHSMETRFIPEYEALAREFPNVSVISAYGGDTLSMISGADIHISGWSTCHYEAIGLGTPTIVLRFPGPDRMSDMQGLPNVWSASSSNELLRIIQSLVVKEEDNERSKENAADKLFRRVAVENSVDLLYELANENSKDA